MSSSDEGKVQILNRKKIEINFFSVQNLNLERKGIRVRKPIDCLNQGAPQYGSKGKKHLWTQSRARKDNGGIDHRKPSKLLKQIRCNTILPSKQGGPYRDLH